MVISFKGIFIILIIYQLNFSKESNCSNYDTNLILHNSSENQSDYPQNNNTKNDFQLFPIAYLAYIISGFLPSFKNSNNSTNNTYNLVESLTRSKCFQQYNQSYYNNKTESLYKTIRYSGKSYPDYGDEEGCIGKDQEDNNINLTFILFSIYFNISTNYDGKYKLLPFVSQGKSFYGLCIENIPECTNNLTSMLQDSFSEIKIFNLDVYTHDSSSEKDLKYKNRKIIHAIFWQSANASRYSPL